MSRVFPLASWGSKKSSLSCLTIFLPGLIRLIRLQPVVKTEKRIFVNFKRNINKPALEHYTSCSKHSATQDTSMATPFQRINVLSLHKPRSLWQRSSNSLFCDGKKHLKATSSLSRMFNIFSVKQACIEVRWRG